MKKTKTKASKKNPLPSHLTSLYRLSNMIGRDYMYLYSLQQRHRLLERVPVEGRARFYFDIGKSLKAYKKFQAQRAKGFTISAAVEKAKAA